MARAVIVSAVSFGLIVGVLLALAANYDRLPEQFPSHYGPSGKADAFRPKSPVVVFSVPVIGIVVLTMMSTVLFGAASGPQTPRLRLVGGMFAALSVAVALLLAFIAATPLTQPGRRLIGGPWVALGVAALIPLITIGGMIRWFQLPRDEPPPAPPGAWKAGVFYYNPANPAFLVPRRDGLGYTTNFAHRAAWIVPLCVVAILVCTLWLMRA